jgi:hypothetical protein
MASTSNSSSALISRSIDGRRVGLRITRSPSRSMNTSP